MTKRNVLVLDAVGNVSRQLRVLQERTICRVGSSQMIPVDFRVIAATHVNLQDAVAQSRFREDLFYRLNVLHLELPPLRHRGSDITLLAEAVFQKYAPACKNSQIKGFSKEALRVMRAYDWPGNVRELINRVQRAMVMSENRKPADQWQQSGTDCASVGRVPRDALPDDEQAQYPANAICGAAPMMQTTSLAPCPACHCRFDRKVCCFFQVIWRYLLAVLFLTHGHAFAQTPVNEFKLGLPIDCIPGQDCHILAYVDELPGPEFRDVGGGRQTYDGHDGTDFGVADEARVKKGVAVKAAAAGTVVQVRDGVADRRVENSVEAQTVNHIGCGNAVVIEHPNEWRTTYCHLRKGSLTVKTGMHVAKGVTLGIVGISGLTSYPHVHFGVRHHGRTIDPFTGLQPEQTAPEASQPLWEMPLVYAETGLINSGFSNQQPRINAVWQGTESAQPLTTGAAAIFFWVHPFGILAGDVEQFRLLDPRGMTVVGQSGVIDKANRINWLNSVAKRNAPGYPLSAGIWQGHYQLRRGDKLLIDIKREIEVKAP